MLGNEVPCHQGADAAGAAGDQDGAAAEAAAHLEGPACRRGGPGSSRGRCGARRGCRSGDGVQPDAAVGEQAHDGLEHLVDRVGACLVEVEGLVVDSGWPAATWRGSRMSVLPISTKCPPPGSSVSEASTNRWARELSTTSTRGRRWSGGTSRRSPGRARTPGAPRPVPGRAARAIWPGSRWRRSRRPACRASWTAAIPTPPAAAWIRSAVPSGGRRCGRARGRR